MSSYNYRLLVLLASILFFPGTISTAAETDSSTQTAPSAKATPPVEVSPEDPGAAGKAKHACKQEHPCEDNGEGDYLGPALCADCHQD